MKFIPLTTLSRSFRESGDERIQSAISIGGAVSGLQSGANVSGAPVFACNSSRLTSTISRTTKPCGVTSTTARSVYTRLTQRTAVSGSAHFSNSRGAPLRVTCSMITRTSRAQAARSIAPQIIRAMHRQADAEIDHLMVLDVLRGTPGDLQAVERAHTATTRST